MPRGSRLRDYLMHRDSRNPYSSRDYANSRRMVGRGSKDYNRGRNDYAEHNSRMDYRYYPEHKYSMVDMAREQSRQYYNDGHYPMNEGKTYYPIEAMGTFNGYWGTPQDDYGYDMNYDYARNGGRRDYGYDYAGDYGEKLSKQEIEHWHQRLMHEVDDKDRNFFSKENIASKARQMGIEFDKFSEDELALVALMMYTDYCKTLGTSNMDLYIRLAKDWICDDDVAVKYGEKIAVYHDCIVNG